MKNHCHDCNSDYEQPGTCNCFAPGGKRYVTQPLPYPVYVPLTPYVYPYTSPVRYEPWCQPDAIVGQSDGTAPRNAPHFVTGLSTC